MTNEFIEPGFYWFKYGPSEEWSILEIDEDGCAACIYSDVPFYPLIDYPEFIWGPKIEEPTQC